MAKFALATIMVLMAGVVSIGAIVATDATPTGGTGLAVDALPAAAAPLVDVLVTAGTACPQMPLARAAAHVTTESGWNPRAVNATSGASGLVQFMGSTWPGYGPGGPWGSRPPADHPVFDPATHLDAAMTLFCAHLSAMEAHLATSGKPIDLLDAVAVCHVAGCSRVTASATGIPGPGDTAATGCGAGCIATIRAYLERINTLTDAYTAPDAGAPLVPVDGLPPPPRPYTGGPGGCTVADPTTSGCVTPTTAWLYRQILDTAGSLARRNRLPRPPAIQPHLRPPQRPRVRPHHRPHRRLPHPRTTPTRLDLGRMAPHLRHPPPRHLHRLGRQDLERLPRRRRLAPLHRLACTTPAHPPAATTTTSTSRRPDPTQPWTPPRTLTPAAAATLIATPPRAGTATPAITRPPTPVTGCRDFLCRIGGTHHGGGHRPPEEPAHGVRHVPVPHRGTDAIAAAGRHATTRPAAGRAGPAATAPAPAGRGPTPAQLRRATAVAAATAMALDTYRADGTRPAMPNVAATSWLATLAFTTPPPAGHRRTITRVTTDLVAASPDVLYIHTTWHRTDHHPGTPPRAGTTQPPIDVILELAPHPSRLDRHRPPP